MSWGGAKEATGQAASRLKLALMASLLFLATFVLAQEASAAEGDFALEQCISSSGTGGACLNGGAMQERVWDGEASPDGRHVYQSSFEQGGNIRIFDRDPATGSLEPRSGTDDCYGSFPSGSCTGARALFYPTDVLVSPDGQHVYVAGWSFGAVVVFDRDPVSGRLTQKPGLAGCISQEGAGGCRQGRALDGVWNLLMSPDGKNLYATAQTQEGSIAVLRVEPDGSLQQPATPDGCITDNGLDDTFQETCIDGTAIGRGYNLVVSPDGRHAYAAGSFNSGVTLFNRDTVTGELLQKGGLDACISVDGSPFEGSPRCRTQPQLNAVGAVLISNDGKWVYALGADSQNGSIVVFSRAQNGLLTFQSCVNELGTQKCADGRSVSRLGAGAISPDGKALVARNRFNDAWGGLSFFDIGADGNLTQRPGHQGCATQDGTTPGGNDECQVVTAMGGEGNVEFASNSSLLYGGFFESALIAFDRELRPSCRPAAAATRSNTSVPVVLRCSDPNGDPLTFEVVRPPAGGTLGPIDPGTGSVLYAPAPGFAGTDTFEFRAVANGLASPTEVATVGVEPPAVVAMAGAGAPGADADPAPPSIPERIRPRLVAKWAVRRTETTVRALRLLDLPSGASVSLRCRGRGCPVKRKGLLSRRGGAINLRGLFGRDRSLRPGDSIEIRITLPGWVGKVVRYAVRRGKAPAVRHLCLPPGGSTPRPC